MASVAAVASSANVADLGTKRLPCHTMRRLVYEVGVYDGSGRVGVEEFEEHQQKALIKRVMSMTSTTPSLSTRSSGTLQLALLTAMLPNALGSRVAMGGQSIFWMNSITIPLWFVVVIVLVAMAVAWYLINEIRGLRKSLYSWRDLCNDMDSDDREVRRRAMRRYQRSRRMMTPSTYDTTEAERDGLLEDFAETGGVLTDGGRMNQEDENPLRVDVLRNIGQHMQLNTRENTIFIRAFSELNPRDKETMNCLVNMLYFMNSGDENQVRQSFMSMGIILQKIGARTMPLGSPESEEGEEEDSEQDEEREEDKRQRYLHSSLEECSDTEYWMSLHHHYEAGDSDDPMEVEEESEEDHGPPEIDWATANANQRMDYEGAVRRLNQRADRAEELSNHEGAARLRMEADNLEYL